MLVCYGFLLYRIKVSKANILLCYYKIAQFIICLCRCCTCQTPPANTSILPILFRRLLSDVSANSLWLKQCSHIWAILTKWTKSSYHLLCLSDTHSICKNIVSVVQFYNSNLDSDLLTPCYIMSLLAIWIISSSDTYFLTCCR